MAISAEPADLETDHEAGMWFLAMTLAGKQGGPGLAAPARKVLQQEPVSLCASGRFGLKAALA